MEMADMIAINKADGTNIEKANIARGEYQNALHLFPPSPSGWIPKVTTCSATQYIGILEIWGMIIKYKEHSLQNNYFHTRRKEQSRYWMYESINDQLKRQFYNDPAIKEYSLELEKQVLENRISSFVAASELIRFQNQKIKKK